MRKQSLYQLIITVFFFLISMILLIIPGDIGKIVKMFLPVLFFAILAAILNGWFSGFFIGTLSPFFIFLILHNESFVEDIIYQMISFGGAAITAAVIYRIFKTAIGASFLGVLSSRILLLLSRLIGHYILSSSYTVMDHFYEGYIRVYPGLLLPVIIIPVLVLIFRRRGLMKILRNETED